ncbi:MAG: hypothetical protein KDH09_20220 [Chrysiogenetes bacterium]|nr:hypothetical protein [Chrysiogenetes bacterium]
MSEDSEKPVEPANVTAPAPLFQRRGVRIGLAIWAVTLVLIVGFRVCVWRATRWNPQSSVHMQVRNSLYYLVDRIRMDAVQGRAVESAFQAWGPEVLERAELREFSLYLSDMIVIHGQDSEMPKITPLSFSGPGAPSASPGTGALDFQIIAARRTGEDEALVWAVNASRDIVFREFEIQRPALQ